MAWRIHDSVARGEIDNRIRGRVRGRLWLHGVAEPVILDLEGNAQADLAGCLLQFENPSPTSPMRPDDGFAVEQRGSIGDLTASRKVRVFDIPVAEAYAMSKRGEKPPEHLANCLYLEWFSEANGRVVIEGTDWRVSISAPEWRFTPEDEQQRSQDAAHGLMGFMQRLTDAVDQERRRQPDAERDWDEFDWEQSLRESDALGKKYAELLDKYGDAPNADELIAREMGWDREPDGGKSEEEEAAWDVDEMNRIAEEADEVEMEEPDPATEGIDWIRSDEGYVRHPLQDRCSRSAMDLWHACGELGLSRADDPDLEQLLSEFQITGSKLAGALNGLAQGRAFVEPGFIVACLKRALSHLHAAQEGLEKAAARALLPKALLQKNRRELFEIREQILALMVRFRGKPPEG